MKKSFCLACILLITLGSCRLTSLFGSTQLVPDRLRSTAAENARNKLQRVSTKRLLNDPGQTLWLMAYNTFLRPAPVSWGDKNDCRAPEIGKELARTPADIVVLNEAFSPPHVEELVEKASEVFPFHTIQKPASRGLKTNGGLSILSRYPIEWVETRAFDTCSGTLGDCMAKKGFLHALIKVSSDLKVNILATHLDAGDGDDDRRARRAQMQTIDRYRTRQPSFRRWPTVLMGDMNVNGIGAGKDADPEYYEMMSILGDATNDAFLDHNGPWSATPVATRQVNTANCSSIGFEGCDSPNEDEFWEERERLDYIFTFPAPPQQPELQTDVLAAAHPSFASDACGTGYLSDHRAVAARVRFGPEPQYRVENERGREEEPSISDLAD